MPDAPERVWLESSTNSHLPDPGLTFTAPAWQWIECEANSPRAFQYVRADIADAQAEELRAEGQRLKALLSEARRAFEQIGTDCRIMALAAS